MFKFPDPKKITPNEFESTVHSWFKHFPEQFQAFDAQHLEAHTGIDGDYEIDVTVRFTAFGGAEFLVICECKKHSNAIERGLVQILNDKKRSLSAHKAIMVSTAPFQSGACEYAKHNRIGLVEIVSGSYVYITNAAGSMPPRIYECPDSYCGVLNVDVTLKKGPRQTEEIPSTIEFPMLITSLDTYQLEQFLQKPEPGPNDTA